MDLEARQIISIQIQIAIPVGGITLFLFLSYPILHYPNNTMEWYLAILDSFPSATLQFNKRTKHVDIDGVFCFLQTITRPVREIHRDSFPSLHPCPQSWISLKPSSFLR